jgi:hypothetical protein
MTDFANSFGARYPTLGNVWKVLAEGETPDNLPVEWKSTNYYAHVFSNDDDATVKMSASISARGGSGTLGSSNIRSAFDACNAGIRASDM